MGVSQFVRDDVMAVVDVGIGVEKAISGGVESVGRVGVRVRVMERRLDLKRW